MRTVDAIEETIRREAEFWSADLAIILDGYARHKMPRDVREVVDEGLGRIAALTNLREEWERRQGLLAELERMA